MLAAASVQAAGPAVLPLTDAGKGIYRTLKRQYDYVKDLDKNFRKLDDAEKYLGNREKDINDVIKNNEVRMKPTSETETWLERVTETKQDITNLKTRYAGTQKGLCGMCPFLALRKLGKDIVNKTKDTIDLKDRIKLENFNTIVTAREPLRVQNKYPVKKDGVASINENVEKKLLEYLNDENVKRIGIWGPAGVGKTWIMKNLNDNLEFEVRMFDVVIWVTVGKEWSVRTIQQVIVERLNLDVDGINTDQQVATLISQALVNKKYLLLLDQVFSEINLHDVGIHDRHKDGKLVLASRYKPVCDIMNLDDEIHVERLSKTDAQALFRNLVGAATFDHPKINPIARQVLKECGELPLVIKTVASTLKGVSIEDLWRNKLTRLQSPIKRKLKDMEEVLQAFELVYDDLEEDRKNCLKYGALFPEDYEIYQDYLMECWKAQKFLHDVPTFRKAREEGRAVLKDLIDRCLLESGRSVGYVKMPIEYRKMARGKYKENELLVGANKLIEDPSEEDWSQAKMISFICTNVRKLPERPECGTASTLFLQKNENLKTIPLSFFDVMSELNVLDLYCTGIESLPPSISSLINLKGLYLNDCRHLVGLPKEITELKNLEALDIRRTEIRNLPIEIGELSNLRCLRVSFSSYVGNLFEDHPIKMVSPIPVTNHTHVEAQRPVGRLFLLEELMVDVDRNESAWNEIIDRIRKGDGNEILDQMAREVGSLTRLTSLYFYFPSLECFETFKTARQSMSNNNNINNNNLTREVSNFRSFKIQVGPHATLHCHGLDISGCSAGRHLRYSAGGDTPPAIIEVLKEACSFELIGHQHVKSLSDFGVNVMECLEVCIIEECIEMETILGGNMIGVNVLPYLKKLHISRLQRLNCIWEASALSGSLASLTTLTLDDCSNITKIFSWEMTLQLPKLQHLRLENCSQLDKVIDANQQSAQTTQLNSSSESLPKLKILELINLPKLVSICEDDSLKWSSLKKLEIKDCQMLKNLSLSKSNAIQLRSIECNLVWWLALVFPDSEVRQHLQDRCHFI